MADSREKLGTDPRIGQPARCGLCREPISREEWLYPSLLMTSQKVATYGDYPQEEYAGCMWTDVGNVRAMLVGFSPAGCTSIRIAATSNLLFVAVFM
jgi:hypothetical protein